jgi:Zn-finger nucleic acid-binding protein
MRLVVACPQCKRRYDVSGRPIGGRFRCQCGVVVTIRQQHGQDGTVSPRSADEANVAPERLVSQKTASVCPACGRASRLAERKIGNVAVLECGRCAGLWLGATAFEGMVERASQEALQAGAKAKTQPKRTKIFDSEDPAAPRYRQCPVCGKLMNRQNYGRRSGVVIDVCRTHGVWFDADELPRILEWVRSGKLAVAKREEAADAEREQRREHALRMAEMGKTPTSIWYDSAYSTSPTIDLGDLAFFGRGWFI